MARRVRRAREEWIMLSRARSKASYFILCPLLLLLAAGWTAAQEQNSTSLAGAESVVTATASAERLRLIAPNAVVQLRLEVYDEAGRKLYDTEERGGSVLDWSLQD